MKTIIPYQLPKDSLLPLRDQVCELISEAITIGLIAEGQKLPSCRELASHLKLSRNTIFSAYQKLMEQGLILAKDRSGYSPNPEFVSRIKIRKRSSQTGFKLGKMLPDSLPSELRKVQHPEDWETFPYPFIYNQIDHEKFPLQQWRECIRTALNVQRLPVWSGDSDGSDSLHLIEQLRKRLLNHRGISAQPEEILITSGAQNALFIIASLFASKCNSIAVEDPGYPEARNAFHLAGLNLNPVEVDHHGLNIETIPQGSELIYTTPSNQFPTTVTLSEKRRKKLIALAQEKNRLVIEDDYEAEMSFGQKRSPPIKSMDHEGRVIYLGSLSKTLSPGLRLGFMVAHPKIITEAKAIRRAMLRHPPTMIQDAAALFMAQGYYDTHLNRLGKNLRARKSIMQKALNRHLSHMQIASSESASCFWLKGAADLNIDQLQINLRKKGVLIDSGNIFHFDPDNGQNTFRLGFAAMKSGDIEPGIRLIAEEISNLS